MADSPLIKKLLIKPGHRMTVINSPEEYMERLSPLPEGADGTQKLVGEFGFIHVFAKNSQELEKFVANAMRVQKYDGIFWTSYPKKNSGVKTDLSRDILWKMMEKKGLRAVSAVSIDTMWSALRFRPPDMVKSKKVSKMVLFHIGGASSHAKRLQVYPQRH
ncbi:MAG: hypothetical protein JSV17_17715 [Candidatus Aminicenantes bacterium]|nr:MAG: hypothetical protein JSV17_17715 [Candidatus Aminicenantes bacterium]